METLGDNSFMSENGLQISLIEEDGRNCIYLGEGNDIVVYDIREGEIKEKNFQNPQFEQYMNTFLQSVEDLPRIYEAITKGTYRREDFMTEVQTQGKQTPLQQRETELSALESEARGYDEAEALKNKLEQKEGQNIGE